jgi:HK97 gp10 family phage protein
MSSPIDIRVLGDEELLAALGKMQGPAMDKVLRDALMKGAAPMRKATRAAAPTARGPGGWGTSITRPGDLKKSISMKRGRKSRPPAAVIYAKKTRWYSKWVILGTGAHRIRFPDQVARGVPKAGGNIRHPGNRRPNPYMTRGGEAGTPAAFAAIRAHIFKHIDSL